MEKKTNTNKQTKKINEDSLCDLKKLGFRQLLLRSICACNVNVSRKTFSSNVDTANE